MGEIKGSSSSSRNGGTDLHYAWIIEFLGQHKNEMENKKLLGS
jgi:hypothetical protein